jgi:phosphoglucosamine mutase
MRVSTIHPSCYPPDCPDTLAMPLGTILDPMTYITKLPATPLFGTDGIRSKVGELLTADLALQIGYWGAIVLANQQETPAPIVLGQDSRNSSDMLSSALAAGITAAGVEVWNLGLCPTPGVAHLTATSDAIGGIMISASHNPPGDNGIKFFGNNGKKLSKNLQADIEEGLRGLRERPAMSGRWGKNYFLPELVKQYMQAVIESTGEGTSLSGMKVVLDLACGAAVATATEIFTATGAEVIAIHDDADGDRINVNCGSTHMESLQAQVIKHQAQIGFAFDGDADRMLAVDERGRRVDGDYIMYLWGRDLQSKNQLPGNQIITTVMSNLGFERAWEKVGGKLTRTAVGDQYVQAEMDESGALLGGEQSGHILSPQHSISGDGVLTALHLAVIVHTSGKSLGDLMDNSFQTYPQILHNVRVEDREKRVHWQDCVPLQQAISEAEVAMGDQGRILVRASGTEPLIRVMVEAADQELVDLWTNRLVAVVEANFPNS